MARPGVVIVSADAPPSGGAAINTGTWFVSGITEKGPVGEAVRVISVTDFARKFGGRRSDSSLYDAIDCYFREGGQVAYVGRVVGSSATASSVDLFDDAGGSPAVALIVSAAGPGDYADGYDVTVANGDETFTLSIYDADANLLEEAGPFESNLDAADHTYTYVDVAVGDTEADFPIDGTFSLGGGLDDIESITADDYGTALDSADKGLGPGQVSVPGVTDADVHAVALAHCRSHNRVALLDVEPGDVDALIASAGAITTALDGDTELLQYGILLAPQAIVPGIKAGATRTVPYSAEQAGLEARRDRTLSQNIPAAGRDFPLHYAVSLKASYSDAERESLLLAGVCTARNVQGQIETYGYRTLVDPAGDDSDWLQFNFARLRMAITARAEDVGEGFVFDQIDGRGLKASEFGAAIAGVLLDYYLAGSLYGTTPEDAFRVEVGPAINTSESIAGGELRASAAVRMSPHAELVTIEFVKTPITQSV